MSASLWWVCFDLWKFRIVGRLRDEMWVDVFVELRDEIEEEKQKGERFWQANWRVHTSLLLGFMRDPNSNLTHART
jgi:hypothetical protein